MAKSLEFKTTEEIKIPKRILDQVIGQENAISITKKVAKQHRHLLLIGQPGVGKSLVGQALAELLPQEKLVDILSFHNEADDNLPIIKTLPKGKGKDLVQRSKIQNMSSMKNQNLLLFIVFIVLSLLPWWAWRQHYISDVIYAASLISTMIFLAAFILFLNISKRVKTSDKVATPKLLVDNSKIDKAPFIDGTGAQAGALLGDCLHDPFQSGGLGTPAYDRLVPGMIHRANGGVLFIDEVGNLQQHSQQELLTAMQEKKYPITGQSERSSGAMVRSDPAPTDFILIAAGTLETIKKMHPALRSRIRGYGYEVYMNDTMDDTIENQNMVVQFIAQEVVKDKKIPHFTKDACLEIINEARKRAGIAGKLTLRLRELGGLIRSAGDVAMEEKSIYVEAKHIHKAKQIARTLEQQIADKYIEDKKRYQVIITKGVLIGRVNGLAVMGGAGSYSGIVLPIESEVTQGGKKAEFIATGRLGKIAQEAVKNVSVIILKYFGEDIKEKYDIYIQFLQTAETGGVEGDSASIAVAVSIISALKQIPIKQDLAMTGSLSIRGEVLAVGGVTAKVEAAIEAGISEVLVPKANEKDIILAKDAKIKIIPVATIKDVLKHAFEWKGKEAIWKKINS